MTGELAKVIDSYTRHVRYRSHTKRNELSRVESSVIWMLKAVPIVSPESNPFASGVHGFEGPSDSVTECMRPELRNYSIKPTRGVSRSFGAPREQEANNCAV